MAKTIKKEFRIFLDLHFAISQLIELFGEEDRKFYALKSSEESLRTILSGDIEKIKSLENELKQIKQEEEQKMFSLEALSGALLQILKAKIYSFYGSHKNCPKGRFLFTFPDERPVSVRDIILSGRIQYNHPKYITDIETKKVFEDLSFNFDREIEDEEEKMFKLEEGKVLAYNIITLLNWTTYKGDFEKDMILLFDPEFDLIKKIILDDKSFLLDERKRLLSYLKAFSTFKNNMGISSTEEVINIHDSIGVKAERIMNEIKVKLLDKKGKSKSKKELIYICETSDPRIYIYN